MRKKDENQPFSSFPPHFCHLYKGILQRGVSPATKRTKADCAKGQGHLIAFFDENQIPFTFHQVLNVIKCYILKVPISQKLKMRKKGTWAKPSHSDLVTATLRFWYAVNFVLCVEIYLYSKRSNHMSHYNSFLRLFENNWYMAFGKITPALWKWGKARKIPLVC